MPSGITAGDLLVIVFSADGDTNCTIGSGDWTRLDQGKGESGGFFLVTGAVFYKVAAGGDTATVTTSTSEQSTHIVYRLDNASEIYNYKLTTGSSANSAPQDLDTALFTSEDYLWLVTRSGDSTVQASAAPTGFTDLTVETALNSVGASTAVAEREENGSAGNVTLSDGFTSASEQWVCFTLCIAPIRPLMQDIRETFDSALADPWTSYGVASFTGGMAQMTVGTASAYHGVDTAYYDGLRDLRSSYAFIKLNGITNSNQTGLEAYFMVSRDDNNRFGWLVRGQPTGATITYFYTNGGSTTVGGGAPAYSPTTYKFLRLREDSGTIYWEYANQAQFDANNWQYFNSMSSFASLKPLGMFVNLQAGNYTGIASQSVVTFDDLNAIAYSGIFEATGDATFADVEDFYINYFAEADEFDVAGDATLSASGSVIVVGAVSMTGDATLTAIGRSIVPNEPLENKDVIYKVYDSTGTNFIEEWEVITPLQLPKQINNLGSTLEIEVAKTPEDRNINTNPLATESGIPLETENDILLVSFGAASQPFGEGSSIHIDNYVEIWLYFGYYDFITDSEGGNVDDDTDSPITSSIGSPNGRRMFTGYIASYTPRYGSNATTLVKLNSYSARFKDFVLETGSATTVPYLSETPSNIARSVMDKAIADGLPVGYTEGTIENTGTIVSYTFKVNTYQEALEKVIELAPEDWFWFFDSATNLLWLRAKPTQIDHTFIIGKHIMGFEPTVHLDTVINTIYFKGGVPDPVGAPDVHFFKRYEDAASVAEWGQRLEIISDERVTREDTADILATSKINQYKDPTYTGRLIITAEKYIIEDIQLGHMIAFKGSGNFVDDLVMQVVAIDYNTDFVVLDVGTLLPSPNKRIKDIKRNLDAVTAVTMPDTPDS